MLIERTSIATGTKRVLDLPVTGDQWERWLRGGELIQDVFPGLTADQREFILTGITAEEWDDMFPEDEEDSI